MSDLTNDAKNQLHEEEAKGRKEQAAGAFDEMKGKVKKTVGDAFDDKSMQAKGAAQEMAGKARKTAGDAHADAADAAGDAIDGLD
ncbi:CsbD family protein [Rubrivirga sp.]|uniref:CsbD family protein n=1 Tax=Rubrivirga sp. TaxID=1885344 RepID=UPI003B5261AA